MITLHINRPARAAAIAARLQPKLARLRDATVTVELPHATPPSEVATDTERESTARPEDTSESTEPASPSNLSPHAISILWVYRQDAAHGLPVSKIVEQLRLSRGVVARAVKDLLACRFIIKSHAKQAASGYGRHAQYFQITRTGIEYLSQSPSQNS